MSLALAAGRLFLALGVAATGAIPAAPALAQSAYCGDAVALQIGETLASVARKCAVPLGALIAANPQIANPNAVRAGTIIRMPGSVAGNPPRPSQPIPGQAGRYVVRPGDTLSSIARGAGVPLATIYVLNPDIDARTLRVGDVVRLPGGAGNPPPRDPPPAQATQYVVRPGDTLSSIAARVGLPISAIIALNPNIDARYLRVGDIIRIAGSVTVPPRNPPPPSGPLTQYTVRPGDTLGSIARMAGLPVAAVAALNPQTIGRYLRVGEVIRLPGGFVPYQQETIALNPTAGAPGSTVQVSGSNFEPGRRVDLLLGSSQSELEIVDELRADSRGRVSASVSIPKGASRRETVTIGLDGQGPRSRLVTQSFRIRQAEPNRVTVIGTLTNQGAECQAMRGDDGRLYTLTGDLEGYRAGDRVEVEGRRAEASICMQGTTIEVRRIREAD